MNKIQRMVEYLKTRLHKVSIAEPQSVMGHHVRGQVEKMKET